MFKYNTSDIIVLSISLVLIILSSIGLHFWLKDKKTSVRKIPLQIIGVLIVLLEIVKQIYYFTLYKKTGNFDLYVLPLHFCSLFIVLFPVIQFSKPKIADKLRPLAVAYSLLMTIMLYVNPHALLASACNNIFLNFHNFHTYLFHHLVIAYFVYTIALNDYHPHKNDFINCCLGVAFYGLYAIPFAYILKVNYVNILYSVFEPLEKIRQLLLSKTSYVFTQIIYDLFMFLIACLTLTLISKIYYLVYNAKNNKNRLK